MILPDFQLPQLLDSFPPPNDAPGFDAASEVSFSGVMKDVQAAIDSKPSDRTAPRKSEDKGGAGFARPAKEKKELLSGPSGERDRSIVEEIKKELREKNISAEKVVVNDAAMAGLKRALVRCGFDSKQIQSAFEALKENAGAGGVRLSELLKQLAGMEDGQKEKWVIDYSALPYMESVLSLFLPDPDQRQLAMDGVRLEGEGLDMSRLIANLHQILQQLSDKGRSVPDGTAQQQIAKLMEEMGMSPAKGALTLERFVQELEARQAAMAKSVDTDPRLAQDLKSFWGNLQLKNEAAGRRNLIPMSQKSLEGVAQSQTDAEKPDARLLETQRPEAVTGEKEGALKSIAALSADGGKSAGASRVSMPAPKQPVRTLPAYVLNQVSRQIVRSHQNGTQEIRLQLHPPNLGRLLMRIDGGSETLRVHIITENPATQELLSSHAGELKSVLLEKGFRLDKVDFQFDQFFDQNIADHRQDSNGSNRRHQQFQQRQWRAQTAEKPSETQEEREGQLDLVA